MSHSHTFPPEVKGADTLVECIELAENNNVSEEVLVSYLVQEVWKQDVPFERASEIIEEERERLAAYKQISVSESSRAARYMDLTDLQLLSGHEFEHVLAEILCRVEGDATVTRASGDQGVDVVWFRDDVTVGIQAKAYNNSNPVGNSAVQEIFTGSVVLQSEFSIDTAAVVTTSRYTKGAKQAAQESDVALYGRTHLNQWLSEAELDTESMGDVLNQV